MTSSSKTKSSKQFIAEVSEVFSSIQGEGPYLGKKQIFIRFGQCNMHCQYCDEFEKMKPFNENSPLGYQDMENSKLWDEIHRLEQDEGPHHSISLTGGEPLLYAPFLLNFLPQIKQGGFLSYLETNGTLPKALKKILPYIDIIAMDMKPPSSTGDKNFWQAHEEFLSLATSNEHTQTFVKLVITSSTEPEEIARCISIIEKVNHRTPVIFQPESEAVGISQKALSLIETKIMGKLTSDLEDVRVIPQMHKIWGVR